MRFSIRIFFLLLLVSGWACPVFADMVFPARLELVESQPGLFDVKFDLPVQNQARIKATPVLPSLSQLTGKVFVDGMRGGFVRVDLLLLIWLTVLFGRRLREAVVALTAGGLAYALAQAFAGKDLLLLPASLPAVVILLVGVYLANRLANGGDIGQKQRYPAWVAAGFIGALYGGAVQGVQMAEEFSRFEQGTAFFAYITGVMTGLLVIFFLCLELRRILGMIKGLRNIANERRVAGTITGIVALGLLLMAAVAWPRRSKVAAHLNIDTRKPVGHIVLLILAIFLLNVGTIQAQNPMFEPDAPRPEQARRIIETVLTNIYNAFNLKDEEQLYKQLSDSVDGDLVEEMYLDSRRRLTSGVRQGPEVTVQDVSVLRVGKKLIEDSGAFDRFAYEVQWAVTARVRHLQHVHHRRNMYTGILKIRADDGQWKIQEVDLESDDRAIVPGRPM